MVNYQNSVIYMICCDDLNVRKFFMMYTTNVQNTSCLFKANCIHNYAQSYYSPMYRYIRNHGGYENWSIVIVEEFPCDDLIDLRERTFYWDDIMLSKKRVLKTFKRKLLYI